MYVSADTGTLTGILGPAGAGKSIFLKLLCGYLKPSQGSVHINGLNLHRDYKKVRQYLGYVPQGEIMIPELTVSSSLDYRIRLTRPSTKPERRARILQVLADLGFSDKLGQITRQRIGKPEWQGNYLSGGERRRINIAHELVNQPDILVLDEPTSGLSASDAERVLGFLRHLADEEDMTIVFTIHQPGRELFGLLDDLLIVSWSGQCAYYGPRNRAIEYLHAISGIHMQPTQNPAEFVLDFVRYPKLGRQTSQIFKEASRGDAFPYLRIPDSPEEAIPA